MTTVNTSTSGTTYITGTTSASSGTAATFDASAIIKAAVNAKLVGKTAIENKITANANKVLAYQDLQSKAVALKTALGQLQSDSILDNVFDSKQVSYSTSDGSSASSILSATTITGAQAGNYDIVVEQIAKSLSVTSDVQTSQTTALGYTGSFTIGETGKTAATISVTSGMTLQDLRNAINKTTQTSGVSADILQLGNGQFKLIISGNDTATNVTVSGVTGTDVLTSLGVTTSSGGAFKNIPQPAQQAKLTINGSDTIYSDTNSINNVLTGVNLTLSNSAPSTTVHLTLGNNVSGVTTAVQNFVTEYNALKDAIDTYNKVSSDGTADSGAYLYGDNLSNSLRQSLSALVSASYGQSGGYNSLRSIGITFTDSNDLQVDTSALTTALQNNYASVTAVFASTDTTTGFADKATTLVDSYSNFVSGQFTNQISQLQSTDNTLAQKADDIQTQTDTYEQQLIQTYAKLQAQIQQAEITKKQILAILNANSTGG